MGTTSRRGAWRSSHQAITLLIGALFSVGVVPRAYAKPPTIDVLVSAPDVDGLPAQTVSGDAVTVGMRYRILVVPHSSAPLTLDVVSSNARSRIFSADRVVVNHPMELPDHGGWFTVKSGEAEIKVIAEQAGESADSTVRVVDVTAGMEPSQSGAPARATNERTILAGLAAAVSGANSETVAQISRYRTAALKMATGSEPLLRGGTGAKIFREAGPGVVLIVTDDGLGSGIVVSPRGDILTNSHVVGDAKSVGVVFKPPAGQNIRPNDVFDARVTRIDQVADLALIQLTNPPAIPVALKLGDEKTVEVGASVHAIGHPSGEYWTYTEGVISQIRADYSWTDETKLQRRATVIQTQTPINPGNSGGPLLDDSGAVIGINSFVEPQTQGLNFAVSVSEIRRFLASSGSRMAAHIEEPTRPAKAARTGCEPRPMQAFIDPRTKKQVIPVDTECNGKASLYLVGEPNASSAEYALIDDVGDGKIDIKIVFGFQPHVNLWIFYGHRDGIPTAFGYDHGAKGKPDRVVAFNGAQR